MHYLLFIFLVTDTDIILQLIALSSATQKVHDFTNNEIKPTALKAVAKWNQAQEDMWMPFVQNYNTQISQVQVDLNSTLATAEDFAQYVIDLGRLYWRFYRNFVADDL
jgi:hypothetical protein